MCMCTIVCTNTGIFTRLRRPAERPKVPHLSRKSVKKVRPDRAAIRHAENLGRMHLAIIPIGMRLIQDHIRRCDQHPSGTKNLGMVLTKNAGDRQASSPYADLKTNSSCWQPPLVRCDCQMGRLHISGHILPAVDLKRSESRLLRAPHTGWISRLL